MKKLTLGLLALPLLGACGMPAVQSALPAHGGAPVAVPVPALPVCDARHGYMVDGHLTVTVLQNTDQFPCDLVHDQRLNLVYNSETEGADWGSDASVEWAADDCDWHGGRQFWVNDGDYRLVCQSVDF